MKQIQNLLSASRELAKLRLVFYVKGNCLLLTSTYLTHHKKKAELSAFKSKFTTKFEIISSRKKCLKNRNEFDSLNLLYLKILFFSDTLNL